MDLKYPPPRGKAILITFTAYEVFVLRSFYWNAPARSNIERVDSLIPQIRLDSEFIRNRFISAQSH